MSRRSDGSYRCDRCGLDVGNAAVTECGMFADIEFDEDDTPSQRNLHFCRVPNPGAPDGCAALLLPPSMLTNYLEVRASDG